MVGSFLSSSGLDDDAAVQLLRRVIRGLDLISDDGSEVLLLLRADVELYEDLSTFEAGVEDDEDDGTSELDGRTLSPALSVATMPNTKKGYPVPTWSPPIETLFLGSQEPAVMAEC